MKPKEVQRFFDSAIRKLRKIYGTEASTVTVAAPTSWSYGDSMAVCIGKVDWQNCQYSSALAINAPIYSDILFQYELDEEVGRFTIANTVCHEMAHHLGAFRKIKEIRNSYVHDLAWFRHRALADFIAEDRKPENFHNLEWQNIMEEMGADPTSGLKGFGGWRPIYKLPSIFAGRL